MVPIVWDLMSPAIPATVAPMTLDTVWLSYSELADKLGITPESVRNLVRRRGWPRKPGNDGAQRIGVPVEYLDERATSSDEAAIVATIVPPTEPPIEEDTEAPIIADTVVALEGHIATLKTVVEHERQRADKEHERADAERERAADERARADKERARADALAAELAKIQADDGAKVARLDRDVVALRAALDEMRRPTAPTPASTWWHWIGAGRVGRAS